MDTSELHNTTWISTADINTSEGTDQILAPLEPVGTRGLGGSKRQGPDADPSRSLPVKGERGKISK